MPCASCESPFSNYLIAAKEKYNVLLKSSPSIDQMNPIAKIQLIGRTVEQMVPIVYEGITATMLEIKNKETYNTGVRYVFNDKNQMVYATGSFAGLRPRDLHERTARFRPDLYNPEDLEVDLVTEAAFRSGATRVISAYSREENDNRNINIYELDPVTKIISLTVINTAIDGEHHAYNKIAEIAQRKFPDLKAVSGTNHFFVLSDGQMPQERVKAVMMPKGKENDMEIQETQMRLDAASGKVFTRDKFGKEIDIESLARGEKEQKQKRRLIKKIKSCRECAVQTGKTEAFFYAPDNLEKDKKPREISQILVDQEGNVTFKTVVLSEDMANSDLQHLLVKLGYKKEKTPREFSYTDDPVPDVKMKIIIKEELKSWGNKSRFEFISVRIVPVEVRLDFLRNNSPLHFYDVAYGRVKKYQENREEHEEQVRLFGGITTKTKEIAAVKVAMMEAEVVNKTPKKNIKLPDRNVICNNHRKTVAHISMEEFLVAKREEKDSNREQVINVLGRGQSPANNFMVKQNFVSSDIYQRTYLEENVDFDYQAEVKEDRIIGKAKDKEGIDKPEQKAKRKMIKTVGEARVVANPEDRIEQKPTDQIIAKQEAAKHDVANVEREKIPDKEIAGYKTKKESPEQTAEEYNFAKQEIIEVEISVKQDVQPKAEAEIIQMFTNVANDEKYKQKTVLFGLITRSQIVNFEDLQEAEARRIWEMFQGIYFRVQTEGTKTHQWKMLVSQQEIAVSFQNQQVFQQQYSTMLAILFISLVNFISR